MCVGDSFESKPAGPVEAGQPLVHLAPLLLKPAGQPPLPPQHGLQLILKHLPATRPHHYSTSSYRKKFSIIRLRRTDEEGQERWDRRNLDRKSGKISVTVLMGDGTRVVMIKNLKT